MDMMGNREIDMMVNIECDTEGLMDMGRGGQQGCNRLSAPGIFFSYWNSRIKINFKGKNLVEIIVNRKVIDPLLQEFFFLLDFRD